MPNIFKDLKEKELEVLRWRRSGNIPSITISRLRRLVRKCSAAPDAEEAICFHGSLALIYEFDQDIANAVKHRKTEISLIRKLYELMAEEPFKVRRFALQNYCRRSPKVHHLMVTC